MEWNDRKKLHGSYYSPEAVPAILLVCGWSSQKGEASAYKCLIGWDWEIEEYMLPHEFALNTPSCPTQQKVWLFLKRQLMCTADAL